MNTHFIFVAVFNEAESFEAVENINFNECMSFIMNKRKRFYF